MLTAELKRLQRTDNVTNWYYIGRTYAWLTAVFAAAWLSYHALEITGGSRWWNLPIILVAVVLIGAGQHHLSALMHEAAHYTLFRNRYLNELAADWLCAFPLLSSTFHYRLHHLAHHHFVNDERRDPDIAQLEASGHRLGFPLSRRAWLAVVLKQLWPSNLLRYALARAAYDSFGSAKNPYVRTDWKLSALTLWARAAYLAALALFLIQFRHADRTALAAGTVVLWLGMVAIFIGLGEGRYYQSEIRSPLSLRLETVMQLTFFTLVFGAVAAGTRVAPTPVVVGAVVLWLVPLGTSFAFFMLMRQLVQHGNADRGRLTNTRVFLVNPALRLAIFPLGQDYHLPHHLHAAVPHYRLPALHTLLLADAGYQRVGVVTEGYFLPKRGQTRPTVADVLGPAWAPAAPTDVYIDESVLELPAP